MLVSVPTHTVSPVMLTHELLPTVDSALASYTNREVKQARLAREQMSILGRPTQQEHEKMILDNTIHNSTVTVDDIWRAHDIFGPAVPALQGKTKRRKPEPVKSTTLERIPTSLFKNIERILYVGYPTPSKFSM